MAKYSSTIQYNLKTTLDASGIQKLQTELIKTKGEIEKLSAQQLITPETTNKAISDIEKVSAALKSSFNNNLGMLDYSKFSSAMSASNVSLSSLQKSLSSAGVQGTKTFNTLLSSIGKFDTGIKSTSSAVDKLVTSLGNTVRWGITSRLVNGIADSFNQAVQYVQDLDDSLTQIMLVTDYSREEMDEYAKSANEAAKALGSTTTEMTNATLIFAQQGFNLDQSDQLAQLSTKLANASQQSTSDTSDQITAYMNAYGLSDDMETLTKAMDSWAEVANVSAADVGEIAEASQKVASTANTTGVTMDQLNAQIATIESVTRDAPESIGNGLKTIYARFSDLEAGETLDDGVSLGTVTSMLNKMGVEVLDGDGKMRGVGDIMEDLMDVWDSIDSTQKAAVAQTLAGKNQLARFEALMNSSDMYDSYKSSSENADGTLDEMNDKYVDSLEGKMKQIQASLEGVFSSLFDTDDFYPILDALKDALDLMQQFSEAVGGGRTLLLGLGGVATKVFRTQIGDNISALLQNEAVSKMQKANLGNRATMLQNLGIKNVRNENTASIVDTINMGTKYAGDMSESDMQAFKQLLQSTTDAENAMADAQDNLKGKVMELNAAFGENIVTLNKEKTAIEFTDITSLSEKLVTPDSLSTAETLIEYIDLIKNNIFETEQAFDKLTNSEDLTEEEAAKLQERFVKTFSAVEADLKDVTEEFGHIFSDEDIKVFNELLSKTNEGLDVTSEEIDEILKKLKSAKEAMKNITGDDEESRAKARTRLAAGMNNEKVTEIVQDSNEKSNLAVQAKSAVDDGNKAFRESMETKKAVESVTSLTSSIMSLTTAWSSFKNLGSIWSNEDLSLGEKSVQTITSVTMAVMELAQAYEALKNVKIGGTITGLGQEFDNLSEYMTAAETAGESFFSILKTVGLNVVKKIKDAIIGFSAAFGPEVAAITLLAGAATVITSLVDGNTNSQFESAKSAYEESSTAAFADTSSFDTAYESYKKTGEATDELKTAANELCETLDIQGGKALAAAGDFDTLATKIDAAKGSAEKYNQQDLETLGRTSFANVKAFTNGDTALVDFTNPSTWGNGIAASNEFGEQARAWNNAETMEESMSALQNFIDAVKEKQASSDTPEKYDQLITRLKEIQSSDSYSTYSDALEKAATTALGNTDTSKFKGLSSEQALKALKSDESLSSVVTYYESMGEEAREEFLAGLTGTSDKTLADFDTSGLEEITKAKLQKVQEVLSDDEEMQLTANFSQEQIIENLNTIIEGINNGDSIEDIIANLKLKISGSDEDDDTSSGALGVNSTEDERKQKFEDAGLDYDQFDSYKQGAISSSEQVAAANKELTDTYQANVDAAKANLAAARETLQGLSEGEDGYEDAKEAVKDYAAALKKAEDAQDAAEESLDNLAAMQVIAQKGADDLAESWDSNYEALTTLPASSEDYQSALQDVVTSAGEFLDIDFSTWSDSSKQALFGSKENLDTLKAAVEGDTTALANFRAAAANQILIDAKVNGLSDEDYNMLSSEIAQFSSYLGTINVGASVDDSAFIDTLDEMLEHGILTEKQVTALLNAMGVDVEYEQIKVPSISYSSRRATTTAAHDPDKGSYSEETKNSIAEIRYDYVDLPKIKSATKTSDGSGVKSTIPSSGSSGGSGGSGSGGSGSGGSGSGSSYEPKTMDKDDSELDLYEKVNTRLDAIAADYEKIANEQDRLSGVEVAKNMQNQIGLIQKQIALYKEKQAIQEQEASDLRSELSSSYGITFDSDGFIANYTDVYNSLYNSYSNLVDQYNATTDESGQETLSDQIDEAKDKLDKFNDKYQRYDELWSSDLKDTIQQLEDLEDEIEDLQAAAFDNLVSGLDDLMDINDTLDKINENWDYLANGLKEDPFADLERSGEKLKRFYDNQFSDEWYDKLISYYDDAAEKATGSQKEFYQTLADQYRNGKATEGDGTMAAGGSGYFDMSLQSLQLIQDQIKEFEETGYSSIFGKNSADLYEAAENVYDQVSDVISEFKDVWDDIHDDIMDGIDDMADKMDDRKESFEAINDELEHYANIIETVHGDKAYDQQNKILQARYSNYQSEITELQSQKKIWEEMLETMEEGSEEWDEVSEKIKDASEEINSIVEESLEALQEAYENTVNSVLDTWTNSAFGGSDLDWIETEWELINRNADYYLDDVNKAYNIQKLQSQYLDLLDDADGLATQQKITAQMNQQLDYLRDKTNLSEYDVQYAQAQLEILQKQIALEEAQNNKNNMKLRRDSQGNYSYVYTADESSTRSAESDLLDAQNNAYNLSKDQMKQTQDDSLSALTDAKSTLMDIWTDASLTVEEREKRVETVIDSLKEYLASTSEQLSTSQQNLINDFIGMCEILTEENSEGMQNVYDQIKQGNNDAFDEIDTRWSTSITNWMQNLDSFNQSTDDAMADLKEDAENYEKDISSIASQVGQDFNDMSDAIDDCKDKQDALNASSKEFYNLMESNSGSIQNYEKQIQSLSAQMQDATNEMANYKKQTEDLQKNLAEQKAQNALLVNQNTALQQQVDSLASGSGSGSGRIDNLSVGSVVGYNGRYYYDSWGEDPSGLLYAGKSGAVKVDEWSSTKYGGQNETTGDFDVHISTLSGGDLGWVKKSQLFDTGGYTGDWFGSGVSDAKDGKLAFLHQKELVLNSSDTENILAAVEAVRSFADGIKNGALSVFSSMFSGTSATAISANEGVQQEVHITAEFPNANSAAEIESALLSLNDRSIQYAYKNR